jgi:predicted nucleic acid-binding protein
VAVHLLDTDILIDFLRGRGEARTFLGRYEAAAEPPVISVVSVAELWAGMRQGEERATDALLSALRKIPLSEEIALAAGNMLRTYRRSHGTELGDALIASTAVELGATLITRNVKHYPMPAVTVLRPY